MVHICSTKIPYKTVGKEYIGDVDIVRREIELGFKDCLREIGEKVRKRQSIRRKIMADTCDKCGMENVETKQVCPLCWASYAILKKRCKTLEEENNLLKVEVARLKGFAGGLQEGIEMNEEDKK